MRSRSLILTLLVVIVSLNSSVRAEQLVDLETLANWKSQGRSYVLVDIRPQGLYERQHLPEAINIPLNVIEHNTLPSGVDVVFYDNDLSGLSSRRAVAAMGELDPSRLFVLKGGLQRAKLNRGVTLVQASGVVEDAGVDPITAEDLREALLTGVPVQIIDIRDAESYQQTSVSRSANVPLLLHPDKSRQIGTDTVWAHVALPKQASLRAAESPKSDQQAVHDAMASEISQFLNVSRSARSQAAVILVDDGSGISSDICRRLSREGFTQARPLERGILSWRLLPNSMDRPEPRTEKMTHGSTLIDRDELRREHEGQTDTE